MPKERKLIRHSFIDSWSDTNWHSIRRSYLLKIANGGNGLSVRKLAEKYSVFKSSAANIFMLTIVFFKLCSKVVFNELWEKLSWVHTYLRNELEKGSEIHFNSYRNDLGEKKSKTSLKWTPPYSGHFEKVPWVSTIERLYCIWIQNINVNKQRHRKVN